MTRVCTQTAALAPLHRIALAQLDGSGAAHIHVQEVLLSQAPIGRVEKWPRGLTCASFRCMPADLINTSESCTQIQARSIGLACTYPRLDEAKGGPSFRHNEHCVPNFLDAQLNAHMRKPVPHTHSNSPRFAHSCNTSRIVFAILPVSTSS
jgi:hypothetical protein